MPNSAGGSAPSEVLQRTGSRRSSGQFIALLYAALTSLTLGILVATFALDYQRTRSDLAQRVEAYAVSMATDVRWYVDVARQSLSRVADRVATASDISSTLAAALSDLPAGVVIVVYDAKGDAKEFVGHSARPVNISDRHYFQQLRDGHTWVISNLLADRVTGTKTFAVGLTLRDGAEFRGAAVAYAPMEVFRNAWLGVGGSHANAFLVHEEGWITARLPPIDTAVYDSPVSPDFVANFTGSPTGVYWAEPSPIDGIARVLGFAKVESTPLVAVIGVDPNEDMAGFWWRLGAALAILAPVITLLGIATWRVRRIANREAKTAEQLQATLAHNEQLLLEIHHRVKNNLQSVLSLVRMQVKDPEQLSEIEPRIAAMVAVHEHIYKADHFTGVPARSYLTDIAQKGIYASSAHIELKTDIDDVTLPSATVMPLGQLVNEAVTNATKYGYSSGQSGTIDLRLKIGADGMAHFSVSNDGAPMPEGRKAGIGSRLIKAFAAQLRGEIETVSGPDGVTVKLDFPLEGATAPRP